MAVSVPSDMLAAAKQADSSLWPVLVAIALNESASGQPGDYTVDGVSFYPASEAPPGAHPTSFGYTQLHIGGGLGDGYSIAELSDPVRNFQIAAEYIQTRLNEGATLYDALSPWTTRSADMTTYQQILAQGITGYGDVAPIRGVAPRKGRSIAPLLIAGVVAYAVWDWLGG